MWLLVDATVDGRIELADAAVSVLGFQQLLQRLRSVAYTAGSLRESSLFLHDYDTLLRYPIEGGGGQPSRPLDLNASIAVDNVHFTYPGTSRPVLRGVSFEVRRGELVAIVGSSGGGKSSLMHLLAGLYEADSGSLRWDGRSYADIERTQLWRSISIMFQDFARFELTAADNIALGDADSHSPLEPAADEAGIGAELASLPDGYQTILSRAFGGSEFSVGQWQRLARSQPAGSGERGNCTGARTSARQRSIASQCFLLN